MFRQFLVALVSLSLILLAGCGSGGFLSVEISELKSFTSPTKLFTMDTPANWTFADKSKSGEAILSWTDVTGNGNFTADVFGKDEQLSQEELGKLLQAFLQHCLAALNTR